MALTEVPSRSESVQQAADRLRQGMAHVVRQGETLAEQVRQAIQQHTKAALIAEFGADATQFSNSYTKLKQFVETADTTRTVPPI